MDLVDRAGAVTLALTQGKKSSGGSQGGEPERALSPAVSAL